MERHQNMKRAKHFTPFAGVGPAGDVWVTNNWQYWPAAFGKVDEALSTLTAGQGVVFFYGMAKPVKTPLIGPPRSAVKGQAVSKVGSLKGSAMSSRGQRRP
jgi:hypothetical protein